MRALAHPTRLALLDALTREGPLTASEAAVLLDDSPGNISWHFQTLAKYGYIEDAGGGKGRSRPWRLVHLGSRFATRPDDSPGTAAAGEALEAVVYEQNIARLREWLVLRHSFEPAWQEAGYSIARITYLTPDELDELGEEIGAVLSRFKERTLDRALRPDGAQPVHLVACGHPLPPTPSGN
jgi:DNA-binding transcriptional ArsR family regulator